MISNRTMLFCFGDSLVFLGALIVHTASNVAMMPLTQDPHAPRLLRSLVSLHSDHHLESLATCHGVKSLFDLL